MPAERFRGTSIVWRSAITSLIVFVLIGVGIAALRAGDLRARSEEAAAVRAELIAGSVIAPLLTPADLEGPIQGARYGELDGAIHEFAMKDAAVERVKIWSRGGMVLFSNDPEQVGLEPELEQDLREGVRWRGGCPRRRPIVNDSLVIRVSDEGPASRPGISRASSIGSRRSTSPPRGPMVELDWDCTSSVSSHAASAATCLWTAWWERARRSRSRSPFPRRSVARILNARR